MTEVLTESFCERCGTRYTFETIQQRSRPLSKLTTLGRGLRHFVVQADASLDEAMAVARSEEEQRVTSAQLDAFHRTFNFCLSCRQYTCRECWNAVEGRCLSCGPLPVEETVAPAAILATSTPLAPIAPGGGVVQPAVEVAGAEAPVEAPLAVGPALDAEPEPEPVAAAEPEAEASAAAVEPEPEPAVAAEPELPVSAEPESEVDVATEPEPEPAAEPVVAGEPLVAADLEPEAVAAAAASPSAEAAASAAPFPGFQPGRSLDDEIAAYELRIAALASIPLDPGPPIAAAAPAAAPAAPPIRAIATTPEPPAATPAGPVGVPAGVAGAPAVEGAVTAVAHGVPGTCSHCGLSISASAKFCRRCGTRQAA
jgi:zinc-ribbon domain